MGRCGGGRLTGRALQLAYRYLGRRERTVGEVRQHLLSRAVDEVSAEAAIEELVEQGALDDIRFARLFVQDKRELEQWGSERIRRGLVARGIDPELADAALAAPGAAHAAPGAAHARAAASGHAEEAPSELRRALGLLRQKFPQPLHGRRERERALGLLLRKGYEAELALDALRAHTERQAA